MLGMLVSLGEAYLVQFSSRGLLQIDEKHWRGRLGFFNQTIKWGLSPVVQVFRNTWKSKA